jgi:glycerophosphoryl diester phosphodiesterase
LQYPEHTLESYKAAAIQGAGVIECDVTFTKDKQLVCRHSQCDLHTTTDVVTRPEMNAKCTTPFVAGSGTNPKCCTSDFTLEELKTLCAKMDSSGSASAASAEAYAFGGTADWRTDLYQNSKCHEIPTHKESIELINSFDRKFTPELKTPSVEMPYDGLTQEGFAQMMIDEYVELGIPPEKVYPQSFLTSDVYYWVENTGYGGNAVALDDKYDDPNYRNWHAELKANGAKIVAPPTWMLVESDPSSELGIKQSDYASSAQEHGLDIITWTLERSAPGLKNQWQAKRFLML